MQKNIRNYAFLLTQTPQAYAELKGSSAYPDINGIVQFYQTSNGVLVVAEICGLPHSHNVCQYSVLGFHIHEGNKCEGDMHDPFSDVMSHYNPYNCAHPFHSGDFPPLFSNDGYAFSVFLTNRFSLSEVVGKTVIIHGNPDDFTTQPSGNSGEKLACGVIKHYRKHCR